MTLFEKIISREIPADIVFETEDALAFRDIHPQAPTHVLVVPKRVIRGLSVAESSDQAILGHLLWVASEVARKEGLKDGYRLVINDGDEGGQTVHHLHLHVLGGRRMRWPPG
jgi:histidine triad (HIT) family protein